MPELPEVHALVTDLGARLIGHTVKRLDLVSFAALKTFDPPASALSGRTITDVARHGKYLDLMFGDGDEGDEVHLVMHLARAGWVRWRESAPPLGKRPGAGPLAARLLMMGDDDLAEGAGLDVTEYGTKKSLAIWVVRDRRTCPGSPPSALTRLPPTSLVDLFAPSSPLRAAPRSRACCAASR